MKVEEGTHRSVTHFSSTRGAERVRSALRTERCASVRRILRCCLSKADYKACAEPKPACREQGAGGGDGRVRSVRGVGLGPEAACRRCARSRRGALERDCPAVARSDSAVRRSVEGALWGSARGGGHRAGTRSGPVRAARVRTAPPDACEPSSHGAVSRVAAVEWSQERRPRCGDATRVRAEAPRDSGGVEDRRPEHARNWISCGGAGGGGGTNG